MSYKSVPRYGICVDFETSGADFNLRPEQQPTVYQGISVGVVVYDTLVLEPVDTLYREIKFDQDRYRWTAEAEAIHGLSLEHLAVHGNDRLDVALDLAELVLRHLGPNTQVPFMGHNRDFDIAFTTQLFNDTGVPSFNIHHVTIDSSGIAFTLLDIYRSNDLFDLLGLGNRGKHNALDDALLTLEACRRMKLIMKAGLET